MSRTTKKNPERKDGFLFLGNQLALDFLNTRPVQNGERVELLPDFSALLRWYRAAHLISVGVARTLQSRWGESARARHMVGAARKLRERLRKEVLAWQCRSTVSHVMVRELNQLLAAHPMRSRLQSRGNRAALAPWFRPQRPEDLFAPLAHSAAALFAELDPKRIRKCKRCVLHFRDTSKKGTRRWCSMKLCGNRLKVAAYAARKRRKSR